jgi:hypothetical protein
VAGEVALPTIDGQEVHGDRVEGGLALGRRKVDMSGQEAFQVGVVYEAQGEIEGRESLQSLRVI